MSIFCTKEADILVGGCCCKNWKFYTKERWLCVTIPWDSHSVIAFTTLNIFSIHCFVRRWLDWSEARSLLIKRLFFKVIWWDIVIRFNSLTFAWIALSGFRSTGKPLFNPSRPFGFSAYRCTNFFILSLIFSRTFMVRQDALIFA